MKLLTLTEGGAEMRARFGAALVAVLVAGFTAGQFVGFSFNAFVR